MQIPQDKPIRHKMLLPGVIAALALIIVLFWHSVAGLRQELGGAEGHIKTAIVQRATFAHKIAAFGRLKPSKERVILSKVDGIISELELKPGAVLTANQVILRLVNPQISRELENVKFELAAARVEYALGQAAISEQALTLRSDEKMAQADLNIMSSELAARSSLAERKIISALDYSKVKQTLEKAKLRHQLSQEKLANFIDNKPIKLNATEFGLIKAKRQLQMQQADHQSLEITPGMAGVLQSMDENLQLGSWVTKGSKIGVVADNRSLFAQLEVNAADAALLSVAMAVQLNVKGQFISANISRIAPNVVNNRVQMDATLSGTLPDTARPDVEVNAEVLINQISNTLVLSRPATLPPAATSMVLYVKKAGGEGFRRHRVKVGARSNTHIQLLSVLQPGDEAIISDTTSWSQQVVYLQDQDYL